MISPAEEYKILQNEDNILDTAYFTLFEKYMKFNLRGEDKKIEIDSTDQESLIISKNGGFPIPGIIYTFMYKGANFLLNNPPKTPQEYTDLVPLVFCMNSDPKFLSGINLNLLPASSRLAFLDTFYETFKDFLEREVDVLSQNNKLALNKRFLSYMKSGKSQEMLKLFNKKNSDNYNFAFRKYSLGKIKNFRMIEYPEWKYIPFYEPKDAFRKLSLNQIYKLYEISLRDI